MRKTLKSPSTPAAPATASKYQRRQYTTNGTDFVDYPASQAITDTSVRQLTTIYAYDFTAFPGVANNPNFGSGWWRNSKALRRYNNTNDANYVGINGGAYSTAGTLSYELVEITGDAIVGNNNPPTVDTIPATVTWQTPPAPTSTFTASDDSTPAGSLMATATTIDDPNTSVAL